MTSRPGHGRRYGSRLGQRGRVGQRHVRPVAGSRPAEGERTARRTWRWTPDEHHPRPGRPPVRVRRRHTRRDRHRPAARALYPIGVVPGATRGCACGRRCGWSATRPRWRSPSARPGASAPAWAGPTLPAAPAAAAASPADAGTGAPADPGARHRPHRGSDSSGSPPPRPATRWSRRAPRSPPGGAASSRSPSPAPTAGRCRRSTSRTSSRCTSSWCAGTPPATSTCTPRSARTARGGSRWCCPRRASTGSTPTSSRTGGPALVLGTDLFAAGEFEPVPFAPSRVSRSTATRSGWTAIWSPGSPVPDLRHGQPGRRRGHRPAALPGRVRPPGRAAPQRPGLRARPPGRRPAGHHRPVRAGHRVHRARCPTAGSYRLFLDFRHGGGVRTAEFTVDTRDGPDDMSLDIPTTAPARPGRHRADHRRHDLRLLRAPDRTHAQQARRGRRHGQLRHRDGAGALPGRPRPAALVAAGRGGRLHRAAAGAPASPAGSGVRQPVRARPSCCDAGCWSACARGGGARAVHGAGAGSSGTGSGSRSRWPRRSCCGGRGRSHRAAARFARRGEASMDTLVSLGTLAALGWSLYALLFGTAGEPGMTHPFSSPFGPERGRRDLPRGRGRGHGVHPAGRYVEARSKRRAGAARARAARPGRQGRRRCCATAPRCGCRSAGSASATGSWSGPGETIAADGVVAEGSSAVDAVDAHRRGEPGRGRAPATR